MLLERGQLPFDRHRGPLPVTRSARSEPERANLVAEALHVAELDLLVAADHVRQARQLDGALVALR